VEPAGVLVGIETTEREWTQTARQPGGDYIIKLLNEYQASWALIRQWAGLDAAIAEREAQIQRLERLYGTLSTRYKKPVWSANRRSSDVP
jgi:hypothetical protein